MPPIMKRSKSGKFMKASECRRRMLLSAKDQGRSDAGVLTEDEPNPRLTPSVSTQITSPSQNLPRGSFQILPSVD